MKEDLKTARVPQPGVSAKKGPSKMQKNLRSLRPQPMHGGMHAMRRERSFHKMVGFPAGLNQKHEPPTGSDADEQGEQMDSDAAQHPCLALLIMHT